MASTRFKFRVWNKARQCFIPEKEIFICGNGELVLIDEALNRTWVKDNPNYAVSLCTGLHDKNGKLIYEGDIVKYLSGTVNKKFVKYITKWNDNMGQFYISKINPSEYDNWKDWHLGRHDLDYEIIDNIYKNKELLND
jgi:uncharacterized phage protein (TIGR01671 family)